MNCMWKRKRSSVINLLLLKSILKTNLVNSYYLFFSVALMYGKEDRFWDIDNDQNYLISFTDLTRSFSFVARHRRHLPFPLLRVEGHRHHRQQIRKPILHVSNVPDFCLRLESIDRSGSFSFQIFTKLKSKFMSYIKVEQKQTGLAW
jgi:hypothetical protein